MAATMSHVDDSSRPKVCLRAGANIVNVKPIFSHDSKYLFCVSNRSVKVYSTESGECVRQLHAHTERVTGLLLNPANKLQLISCSLDKRILFWDYFDGVMLKSYKASHCLHGLVSHQVVVNQIKFTVLCAEGLNSKTAHLTTITFSNKAKMEKVVMSHCPLDQRLVAEGVNGSFYAAASLDGKQLRVWHKGHEYKHRIPFLKITCIVTHPTEECIATGNEDGKIFYWYNMFTHKAPVVEKTHWHSMAVLDIMFSPQGSFLLSGGYECTLVKWQYATDKRDFLPRLGSPITHVSVSPDNLLYALAHQDNGIHVLSNTLVIRQIYQGLTLSSLGNPVGLTWDPRTSALVSNGKPGHLQFFCLHNDKQLFNLDIVQQNYISNETVDRPRAVTQITQAAFDKRGDWLATYQIWDDQVMTPSMQLKFWLYDQSKQSYDLNTTIDRPHEEAVTSLKFRPFDLDVSDMLPLLISCGLDKKFKLWMLTDDTKLYSSDSNWSCDSVGFYRDLDVGESAFAEDGSLLAVAFKSTITLWDPDTNALRTSLHSSCQTDFQHLQFGRKSSCHLLVSATDSYLYVWNLLSCAVQWCVELHTSVLVSDPLSKYMAVFTDLGDLHVFEPLNPNPVFSKLKTCDSEILSAKFIPHVEETETNSQGRLFWQRHSQLYFMNKEQQLLTVRDEDISTDTDAKKTQIKQNLPQSALSILISKKKADNSQTEKRLDMSIGRREATLIQQMLNTPFNVQPSVQQLCQSFMENRLLKEQLNVIKQESMDVDDDNDEHQARSVDNSDDDEIIVAVIKQRPPKAVKIEATDDRINVKTVDKALNGQYGWFVMETESS